MVNKLLHRLRRRLSTADGADASLGESEARFRLLFEHSPDAIFLIDPRHPSIEWPIVDCNESAARMNGYTRDEVIGRSIHMFSAHPRNAGPPDENYARFWREGVARGEDTHRRKDGTTIHIEYSTTLVTLGGRELVLGVDRDVTARKQAEAALRASEEQFRQIADHIPHVFWLVDWRQQRLVYVSRMYEAIWGRPIDSVYTGRALFLEAIIPEDRAQVQQTLESLDHGEYDEEYRIQRPDGGVRWIRDRAFPIRNAEGDVYRIAGIAEDITERKLVEEQSRVWERRHLELQKLESLESLAGGMAHDFNNLLTVILGSAAVALHELPPDAPAYTSLTAIKEAGNRAAELTRQLLTYVGQGQFEIRPLDLRGLLQQNAERWQQAIGPRLQLRLDLAPALPLIGADATQVLRVVLNLLLNAADAIGDQPGAITIATSSLPIEQGHAAPANLGVDLPGGVFAVLEVIDTGEGMDAATRARIFEPFYTTRFPGRGLGLAAVRGIMQRHAGTVLVSSVEGVGTTVRVLFPALPAGDMPGPPA